MIKLAITADLPPDALLDHLLEIEDQIDGVILRVHCSEKQLYFLIQCLLDEGFDKHKLIIHSRTTLLKVFGLSRIHFRQGDVNAYQLKAAQPHLSVSMAVHSVAACQEAKQHHLDFGLYSHLFPTPSKPGLKPRTTEEINAALSSGLPLIALGGITQDTLPLLPDGFIGYAGIRLFTSTDYKR